MLSAREKVLREIDDQKVVSLREMDRRLESQRRDRIFKDQRDQFLRSQGIQPVDEDADDVDEDALEKQREVIERVQVDEAARILADSVLSAGLPRPRAAMRN